MPHTVQITLSPEECENLLIALGCFTATWFRDHGTMPDNVRELARKIGAAYYFPGPLPAPSVPVTAAQGAPSQGAMPPAAPPPPPAENKPREYWAPKYSAGMQGVESLTCEPIKMERKDTTKAKRLVILYSLAGTRQQASCWEESLFGAIANRTQQRTTFYITRKNNYINIVGLVS